MPGARHNRALAHSSVMKVMGSAHDIIVSEWQATHKLGAQRDSSTVSPDSTTVQIIYFCGLSRRPQPLTAKYRLIASSTINASLLFVIDALRFVFDAARTRLDVDLDADMQLLVAVFEQCARPDINPSTSHWLTRCQETSVLQSSMELFVQTDLRWLVDTPAYPGTETGALCPSHPYLPHRLCQYTVLSGAIGQQKGSGRI
jgi:nuclear pore complex protein Nup188